MNFGSSLSLVLSAGLLSAVSLFAQPNDEWNGKPRIFGVNRLNPHVTSMPYTTVATVTLRNGTRRFRANGDFTMSISLASVTMISTRIITMCPSGIKSRSRVLGSF